MIISRRGPRRRAVDPFRPKTDCRWIPEVLGNTALHRISDNASETTVLGCYILLLLRCTSQATAVADHTQN